jgi:type VI secretion system protein ImpF
MSDGGPAISQSILERLIDTAPDKSMDAPQRWGDAVAQKRASVQRDLEWLLNTRRIAEPASAEFPEVRASLYHFGLPDISSRSADSEDARRQLLQQIEETVRTFEPRLSSVRVALRRGGEEGPHRIRFVIEALLRMEPDPERITFDTVLEVTSGEFVVAGGDDA